MNPDDPGAHQHTPAEERKIREAALDQTLEGSFPASDPASSNPNPDDHEAVKPDARRDGDVAEGELMLRMPVSMFMTVVILVTCLASACGDSTPTTPSAGALVTFAVGNETFRVSLTSSDQVAAARAAQSGGRARIPNGRIVPGTQVNAGWSWHLEDVMFAESTIELCDGRPSDVEREGTEFGGGRFCPWSATVTRIEES